MNWATAIPLVSVLAVVFMAGGVFSEVRAMRKAIDKVEQAMKDSAKDQGGRIGNVETDVGSLKDWRTEMKAAARERRRIDTRGVPIVTDDET